MRDISDELRQEIQAMWANGESVREQMLAADVFDISVDFRYGKVTEKKETGGIRLINLPTYVSRAQAAPRVREHMEKNGWKVEVTPIPRSSRVVVSMHHEALGLEVSSHAMPEQDAMRFCALLAVALVREAANG